MSPCPSLRTLPVQYFSCLIGRRLFIVFRSSCFPWFIHPQLVPQYLFFISPHHNPYRFSRLSVTILEACVTLVVPRMCSFLILSLRVPHMMSNLRSIPCVFHTGECWSCMSLSVLWSIPCLRHSGECWACSIRWCLPGCSEFQKVPGG